MFKRYAHAGIAAIVLNLLCIPYCRAVVGTDGSDEFLGTDIGSLTGASTFYDAGYTGSGVIIANIEAGYVWNGHESTSQGQITQYFSSSSAAQFDRHATWVGQTMVGQGSLSYQRGIAYGSTLWSGAIASSFNSNGDGNYSTDFSITTNSFFTPYYDAMIAGVNAQGTADVINSSYGSTSGQDGNANSSILLDAFAFASAKLICFSAGNSGPAANSIAQPASGFNGLVVGATATAATNYSGVASFSGSSPSDVYDPALGKTISAARARVDIVAPGSSLTLAYYGGSTGGNSFGGTSTTATNQYSNGLAGTSFSSPIVAAGAALLVNAGKSRFIATNPHAVDARVLKAVLMNSATQLDGYNNGQTASGGVITTTQSLDYTQGAGQLNLTKSFAQYTTGTTGNVAASGGSVASSGWAYGSIDATRAGQSSNHNDYTINSILPAASTLTLTLDWFAHDTFDAATKSQGYGAFDNLDLKVFQTVDNSLTIVAQSISIYNSTEHLSITLPSTGDYTFGVYEDGFRWNGINGVNDTSTPYGIAWNDTEPAPEPTIGGLCFAAMFLVSGRRCRPQRQHRSERLQSNGNTRSDQSDHS